MRGVNKTPIEELRFSIRTYNCLRRGNIRYVEELSEKSKEDLLAIRGLGYSTLKEIMSVMGGDISHSLKTYKTWEVLKMLSGNPNRVFRSDSGEHITLKKSENDKNKFELFNPVSGENVCINHIYFDKRQCQWEEMKSDVKAAI
ncbi:RNA polymerase, alpha chain C terminal domain [Peptoclostridium litorale DSM 5388]|uniref:RNA polymerase alpha subunit C-terminal domain-containing protein n=1 Tax=Peptoclostridium litorale DSM 5388 TaxID=1121324 RepID=A0A069RGN5_PEPLI|nr:DNA-directed RNA polymerase subunit alpha C-terminal domain-containing protein [Peptoclostridium litorale]KDR96189.1 hypothetical protein CLIT_4c00260 [Peptoclostridium litorale DSM 5388]SIO13228.1 RNA polymerase, alpha chain C terminal domain [Peptoclostridium litorale DSM 5388]